VERGLASSRGGAVEMIESGRVSVSGFLNDRPASMFDTDARIEVRSDDEKRWVSRGARKLLKALDEWDIDPTGLDCVDIGASTGGFTQVLLERGARRVAAVDVGYGQLAWTLRTDPRVKVMERVNARYLTSGDVGWSASLLTVDASFISLRVLLPALTSLLADDGAMIALVKPQFEVGRKKAGKGVVREPSLHVEALESVASYARHSVGLELRGATYSPIRGPRGNIEFIFLLGRPAGGFEPRSEDFAGMVSEAHLSAR
jgi:23S rRNA (cytidine1920-2'-O)/16S rRNA (cytidine1409-2'-O)-methyltransferase